MDEFETILALIGIDVFDAWGMEGLVVFEDDIEDIADECAMQRTEDKD